MANLMEPPDDFVNKMTREVLNSSPLVREWMSGAEVQMAVRNRTSFQAIQAEAENRARRDHLRRLERRAFPPMVLRSENDPVRTDRDPRDAFAQELGRQAREFGDRLVWGGFGIADEPESKFPEYSKEKFEEMGKEPVVKEIMPGAVKLTKKQANERIKLYLETT